MAQLQKGHTYNPGDVVDAADLNSLVDAATGLSGLIIDQPSAAPDTAADSLLFHDVSAAPPTRLRRCLISAIGNGTVTSVAFTATPGTVFNDGVVHPSGAVEISLSLANQVAGKILAGPVSGSAAEPSFRVLSPVDLPVGTITIAAVDIDWNLGNTFTKSLTANVIFTFSNASAGQTIRVRVVQDASHTVGWPAAARWKLGTDPVMTTGAGATDIYTFTFIGGLYYGTFDQNFLA